MKILWVNSSFLDYRIPVYKRLNELSGGNFYIVYSRNMVPERIPSKINEAIGKNAIAIDGEHQICIGKSDTLANKNIRLPRPKGLYKVIKRIKPDIIIGEGFFQWTPFALKYSIFHKIPLLIGYERTHWTERNCPKWRSFYRKLINKFTDGYLCNGSLTKEYLIDKIGVKENKIFTGTMSADSDGLKKAISNLTDEDKVLLKDKFNIEGKGIIYIYTGYLIERKGVSYLLNAWIEHIKSYPEDTLLLVGGGELYNSYKEKYKQFKSIIFWGTVNYDDIYKYYAVADVFIIPTLEDNWSLVVPEAMSCGLPIACSIYNGCYPELCIENVNGFTFDPLIKHSIIDVLSKFHNVDIKSFGKQSMLIENKYDYVHASDNIYNACIKVYNNFYKNEK